jgi:hypothetical protein
MAKIPTMQRSRGQLATAYAPHSLFTFEGGAGACMALPDSDNRKADELGQITERMIGEQIQEYFEAWAQRAMRGQNLDHPVPAALAVDRRAIADDAVRVRIGDLAFQVPASVGYIPFPLTFSCARCGLYRSCRSVDRVPADVARFREARPTGSEGCADDWQQIDVVLAHWSGEIEGITPSFRHWAAASEEIREINRCTSCESDRFFLRRPPGPLAGWHFECVVCKTPRNILQRDRETLQTLGPLLDRNLASLAEIHMEPVSCRASATYYPHGDRLLVFKEDRYVSLLGTARAPELEAFIGADYGYPLAQLADAEKETLVRAAGRGLDWENYAGTRELIATLETQNMPAARLAPLRGLLAKFEEDWNATIFSGRQEVSPGISTACRARQSYVRRYDPLRMAVEHKTLAEEKLHGGQMNDGRDVSVDVDILDQFLIPDGLSEAEIDRMKVQVRRRRALLGIDEMRLVRDVRVCEYTFAYSRTSSLPTVRREKAGDAEMPVRLRLFDRVRVGEGSQNPVLCLVQSNEGFYVRLNEQTVLDWLKTNNMPTVAAMPGVRLGGRLIEEFAEIDSDPSTRFSRFLDEYRRERAQPRRAYPYVYTLLHTMAHHLIGISASMSGLDLGSFGEHIFIPDLAFLVYRRGMTMDLGNLSSMWRDRGDPIYGNEVLDRLVSPTSLRCGSESICNHRGGACPDCILIPENTCITRNELLSRSALIGRGVPRWDADGTRLTGFYEVAERGTRSGSSSQ